MLDDKYSYFLGHTLVYIWKLKPIVCYVLQLVQIIFTKIQYNTSKSFYKNKIFLRDLHISIYLPNTAVYVHRISMENYTFY